MRRYAIFVLACALWTALVNVWAQAPAGDSRSPSAPAARLTIENIFAPGGITGRAPEAIKWSPDGTKISFVQRDASGEHGELWYVEVATGNKAVLVSESKLQSLAPPVSRLKNDIQREWVQRYGVAAYHWSPDSKYLLFDSRGQLWLYSLETGTAVAFTSSPDAPSDPKFSPDGKRVAFVRAHDLWVKSLDGRDERQLTRRAKGEEDIFNGEVDWVYAEELGVRSNYFWSPNGKQIAFLQMNEKSVPTYPIVDWSSVQAKVEDQKYPKPGDPNPEVRVGVISSGGGSVRWIKLNRQQSDDFYIPRFGWVRDGLLYIEVLNRLQDKLELYFADPASGRSRLVLTETAPDAWINESYDAAFLDSGDHFVWPSWRDGHTHLYLYRFDKANPLGGEAQLERQLTRGDFEVFDIAGINEAAGTIYFTANADDPRQTQLFSVRLDGSGFQRVSREAGTHSALFSPKNQQYWVDNFSSLTTPPRLSLCALAGTCRPLWQSREVAGYDLIFPEQLELKAADGATTLYAYLLLPPGAKQARGRKFPLILNPYGGPGGQSVRNTWGREGFLFHNFLARENGFAVLIVDNRGMANRGKKFTAALRREFGAIELADQLAALDQVLERYPMLDANRIGWYGSSYGGYMTLYAMTHSDRIKAGVSIAPVTDWRLYDSIYTERFMGLLKDNAPGYQRSSPVHAAKDLAGNLLIVHGTSDDNVHVQNTVEMVDGLYKAGKAYDLQLYPGKTHSLSGSEARIHLYRRIQQHFARWLGEDTSTRATD